MQSIRRAHSKITDEEYEEIKKESIEKQEPLTRKTLIEAGKKKVQAEKRATAEKIAEQPPKPLPLRKYAILYADPPWFYSTDQHGKESDSASGGAATHYPMMRPEELRKMRTDIRRRTAEDALLFLWTTGPKMKEAIELGEHWGFDYVTVAFDWNKMRPNPGNYTMSQHEFVLLFKHGKIPQPRGATNMRQSIESKRTKHSEKPDEARKRIEEMFPKQVKIQLFSRQKYEGWDNWGNEV